MKITLRTLLTAVFDDMFNDNDIQEIFDSIGIEQLALKSDIARKAVSNVKKIVTEIRKIEKALGDGVKRVLEDELIIAKKLRAHL